MFLASTTPVAVVLALLSTFCWGSWSNSLVLLRDGLRFENFYVDFTIGVLLTAILGGLTLGLASMSGCETCKARFIPDDFEVAATKMLLSICAGAIFNLANMMLTKGIQMVGLALAFPLCIGTALVLGTLLTRFLQGGEGGNTALLFTGVGVAFLAVCATSLVHHMKDKALKRQAVCESGTEDESSTVESGTSGDEGKVTAEIQEKSPMRATGGGPAPPAEEVAQQKSPASAGWKLGVCLLGGLFMSLWNPLQASAQKGFSDSVKAGLPEEGLSPYGAFFFFSVGIAGSTIFLVPLVLAFPLDRAPRTPLSLACKEYRSAPLSLHLYGLIGGFVWAVGTLSNAVSGQGLSSAASYAIGQSAPMVSIFWGVFLFKEFKGAPLHVQGSLVIVVLLYMASIALIALSQA
eukprot:TRINITY_DN41525_c0_g1_i1.p1 TRINITY_DN41525_c0_g1~~TRINITY_DN41525_c0_g1_i1.p1  ORF type:complete len:406 (+),score=82.06 TRINITY_DN41525_c0_g1_i1:118-1335(+)